MSRCRCFLACIMSGRLQDCEISRYLLLRVSELLNTAPDDGEVIHNTLELLLYVSRMIHRELCCQRDDCLRRGNVLRRSGGLRRSAVLI